MLFRSGPAEAPAIVDVAATEPDEALGRIDGELVVELAAELGEGPLGALLIGDDSHEPAAGGTAPGARFDSEPTAGVRGDPGNLAGATAGLALRVT